MASKATFTTVAGGLFHRGLPYSKIRRKFPPAIASISESE